MEIRRCDTIRYIVLRRVEIEACAWGEDSGDLSDFKPSFKEGFSYLHGSLDKQKASRGTRASTVGALFDEIKIRRIEGDSDGSTTENGHLSTMYVGEKGLILFFMDMLMRMVIFIEFIMNTSVGMSLCQVEKVGKNENEQGFHVNRG